MIALAVDDTMLRLDALAQSFRDQGAGPQWISFPWFMAGLLTLGGCLLVAWVLVRSLQQDGRRHGRALRALSREMGLSFTQRRLVVAMAQAGEIESPVALLISRGCFEHAAQRYLARRGESMAGNLEVLRGTVFE